MPRGAQRCPDPGDMAVAQKAGIPKWVALVGGNMDQNCGLPLLIKFEPHPYGAEAVGIQYQVGGC